MKDKKNKDLAMENANRVRFVELIKDYGETTYLDMYDTYKDVQKIMEDSGEPLYKYLPDGWAKVDGKTVAIVEGLPVMATLENDNILVTSGYFEIYVPNTDIIASAFISEGKGTFVQEVGHTVVGSSGDRFEIGQRVILDARYYQNYRGFMHNGVRFFLIRPVDVIATLEGDCQDITDKLHLHHKTLKDLE